MHERRGGPFARLRRWTGLFHDRLRRAGRHPHGRHDKDGEIAWQTDEELPDVSSPVAADGLLFMGTAAGAVTCYDAKTGHIHWRQEYDEGFYASPVVADGRVYLTDQKGLTHVFAADKEFKGLSKNSLGEPCVGTFAFRGRRAYLRGFSHLYCLVE